MSSVFDIDTSGKQQLEEDAALNPLDASQIDPGFWRGTPTAIGTAFMRSGAKAFDLLTTAGSMLEGNTKRPGQQKMRDEAIALKETMRKDALNFWTPKAEEVGAAGRVLGPLTEMVLPLMLGGGNPAILLGSATLDTGKTMIDQGVDARTATASALLTDVTLAAGFRIPFVGKTVPGRMASGVAGNVAIGLPSREGQQAILESAGYGELAKQYDYNGEAFMLDALTGAAFGGLSILGMKKGGPESSPMKSEEVDALLSAKNAKHFQQDTAPGVPADAKAAVAHQQALGDAIEQLLKGEPVNVSASITEADFIKAAPQETPQETPITRAIEAAYPDLVPPKDLAALPLPQRQALRYNAPELDAFAATIETKYNLPPGLINAIKNAGEKSNSNQTSPAGARGVMQFMPENLKKYGVTDPTDPVQMIDAAGRYLKDTLKQYKGDVQAVIADYNGGPRQALRVAAGKAPAAPETRKYLDRVTAAFKKPLDAKKAADSVRELVTADTNFRAWFADSKVIDDKGAPLVVYHGTATSNLDAFDTSKSSSEGTIGKAIYVTSSPEYASEFANGAFGAKGSPSVMPLYVRAKKILDFARQVTDDDIFRMKELKALSEEFKLGAPITHGQLFDFIANRAGAKEAATEFYKKLGYDAIKFTKHGSEDTIAVFDPKSLKSAVANSGAYDPLSGSITDANKVAQANRYGADNIATTERGMIIPARYAVTDIGSLVTSHLNDLKTNPDFPQALQPRDRARASSEAQIARIENAINPELLGASPKAGDGAPIVGADNVVESGNARTIALRRAYEGGKADGYKQWLIANAERFGLDPAEVAKLNRPALVRVGQGDYNRAEFARQANESTVAQMSVTELAKADAERTPDLMGLITNEDGSINSVQSAPFIQGFMAHVVSPSEHGTMMTADGQLSQQGLQRIRNAVFAKAYGDPEIVAMMAESTDANVRNVLAGMLRAAPAVARLKELIEAGARYPIDVTSDIVLAVRQFSQLKRDGLKVKDMLDQAALFDTGLRHEVQNIMIGLEENARAPKRVAEMMGRVVDQIDRLGGPRQASMFDDSPHPTGADLILSAVESVRKDFEVKPSADLFNSPEITAARQVLDQQPDARIVMDDGREISVREAMREVDDAQILAKEDVKAFDAAVTCYMRQSA